MSEKQKSFAEGFSDRENYRELSVPFETPDLANEALTGFQKELYELRKKYRVRDLVFIAQVAVKYEDGEEGEPVLLGMFGDETKMEYLTAYAAGRAGAERQQRIQRVAQQATKAILGARRRV